MPTLLWILFLALNPSLTSPDVCLEYRLTRHHLPGVLGSVTYPEICVRGKMIRVDLDAQAAKILDLVKETEIEIDHGRQIYCRRPLTRTESEPHMVFQQIEGQTWRQMPCQVFIHEQTQGEVPLRVVIYFHELIQLPHRELMEALLGTDTSREAFPTPPRGFPVRVLISVKLENIWRDAVELAFQEIHETTLDDAFFAIPPGYQAAPNTP